MYGRCRLVTAAWYPPVLWGHHAPKTGWGKREVGWRHYGANILPSRSLWRSITYLQSRNGMLPTSVGVLDFFDAVYSDDKFADYSADLGTASGAVPADPLRYYRNLLAAQGDFRPLAIVGPVPNRFFTCSLESVRCAITFWPLKPRVKLHCQSFFFDQKNTSRQALITITLQNL